MPCHVKALNPREQPSLVPALQSGLRDHQRSTRVASWPRPGCPEWEHFRSCASAHARKTTTPSPSIACWPSITSHCQARAGVSPSQNWTVRRRSPWESWYVDSRVLLHPRGDILLALQPTRCCRGPGIRFENAADKSSAG